MAHPLREAADLLRTQLIQKRKEVEELEKFWIRMNEVARRAEGDFVGPTKWEEEEY
jgi:hypothetical protein